MKKPNQSPQRIFEMKTSREPSLESSDHDMINVINYADRVPNLDLMMRRTTPHLSNDKTPVTELLESNHKMIERPRMIAIENLERQSGKKPNVIIEVPMATSQDTSKTSKPLSLPTSPKFFDRREKMDKIRTITERF